MQRKMGSNILYGTELGDVSKANRTSLKINFKTHSFELSPEDFMLFNHQLKRSPFAKVQYITVPNYVVIAVKNSDVKIQVNEEEYYELKELIEGATSIIGIESDLKRLI